MHIEPLAILSGFVVGLIVGLTGVGGGSLMTPLLIGAFRLAPALAIGTDLWFAAITKSSGVWAHYRLEHIDFRVVRLMLAGSLPAAVATLAALHWFSLTKRWSEAVTLILGIALLLTALSVAFRPAWAALGVRMERHLPERRKALITLLAGALLGVLVSLTSIGGGAIGATFLLLLYPRLPTPRIVGTDIAHAVPLTIVAAAGHAGLGHVHWALLAALLIGSLPGIWLGASLTRLMPERFVRTALCLSLVGASFKVVT